MAEETQQYEHMAQGGFAASYWRNKTDKRGLGYDLYLSTAEFHDKLRRRMETNFPVKESSVLFSPHLFVPDLNPGHARTKENSFVSRGIVLDIEKSDMLVFLSHAGCPALSYLHTNDPLHAAIRERSDLSHDRPQAKSSQDGIDSQTFGCASLFYLPSKNDHSFIEHHHDGRQPLNPFDWIEQCPLEVWQAIDAVDEICQRPDYQPTINTSGFLAYMEQRWRSAPLGHDGTEF